MLKNLFQIFNLFDNKTKVQILIFQLFIIFSSFLEVISFGSLIPFFTILTEPQVINNNNLLLAIKTYLKIDNDLEFIKTIGIVAIVLVTVSNIILLGTIFIVAFFGQKIGMGLSHKIYQFYLNQNYTFFTNNDSSYLSSRITTESLRIADGVITASLIIVSRFIFALVITISLLIIDFQKSIIVVLIFTSAYIGIYLGIKKFLSKIGRNTSLANQNWYKFIQESFSAIKELIVLNRLKYYDTSVKTINNNLASYKAWNIALGQSPRYFIEVVAFVFLLGYIITIITNEITFISLIPFLTLYGIAGYKLLPTFQVIYYHYNHLRYHIEAYENLKDDLIDINNNKLKNNTISDNLNIEFKNNLIFENISYEIVNNQKKKLILDNINLKFHFNSINAIIGQSGSGKTTITDILLGLRVPNSGSILIDDVKLNKNNMKLWRKQIGYVPQKIFIINGNILENICIGMNEKYFEKNKAIQCLRIAGLEEFATDDKNGILREIGEKGLKISGGQIQRIGIARALYNNPEVLIFDEVTSALDAIAERKFYKTLNDLLKQNKTIILISHKVDYLKKINSINLIKDGKLYKSGSFQELEKENEFKKLLINDKKNIN